MKARILLILFVTTLISACNDKPASSENEQEEKVYEISKLNRENLKDEIEKRENTLSEFPADTEAKKSLIIAYVEYATRFKSYAKADQYLFKAARLSSEVGEVAESIKYFDKVYYGFPDFEDRPLALFMKAFVQENHAGSLDEAKKSYELFLEKHPRHEMADDARISIQNLGKSPEEIIKEFQKQDSLNKLKEAV